MSMKSWRYRLLHWVNGINPQTKEEAIDEGMPQFLYTHYCPLFHLTNLFLLLSPIILTYKLVKKFVLLVSSVIKAVLEVCDRVYSETTKKRKQRKEELIEKEKEEAKKREDARVAAMTDEEKAEEDKNKIRQLARHNYLNDTYFSPDMVSGTRYLSDRTRFDIVDKDTLHEVYSEEWEKAREDYVKAIVKDQEKEELKREKINKKEEQNKKSVEYVQWINFSAGLIKVLMYGVWAALFCAGIYGAIIAVPYVMAAGIWCISTTAWLFSLFSFSATLAALKVLGTVLFWSTVAVASVVAIRSFIKKFGPIEIDLSFMSGTLEMVATPFKIVGSAVCSFGRGCVKAYDGFRDFIEVIYENHCPPVNIVDESEED